MKSLPLASLFALASVAAAFVACSEPSASPSSSDSDLIHGNVASPEDFPATMQVVGNCTVTKIADDLILTAAHCVRTQDGALRPEFAAGQNLDLVVRGQEPGARSAVIRETILHPQIAHLCQTRGCRGRASDERRDAPDVAVIRVLSGLEGVAIAPIDVDETRPGDAVTILGYGCTQDVYGGGIDGQLRFRDTTIVPTTASIHAGGLDSEPTGVETIGANYVVTPGPVRAPAEGADAGAPAEGADDEAAGLCPGDSGGALYRRGTNLVVGVNASYTFLPGGAVPVTNWHARVDGQSRWGVAAWLESLGAKMSRSCDGDCRPSGSAGAADAGADASADAAAKADGG